jgi:hypothetical protein
MRRNIRRRPQYKERNYASSDGGSDEDDDEDQSDYGGEGGYG